MAALYPENSIDGSSGYLNASNIDSSAAYCGEYENPAQKIIEDQKLVAHILSYLRRGLEDVDEQEPERIHWVSAALSCKGFLEPALDELWSHMDSLIPLFRVLPAFQTDEDGFWIINGSVSAAEWARLEYYAKRIKFFTHEGVVPCDVSLSTYVRLAQLQKSDSLLPALHRFSALQVNEYLNHISLFASSSLESVELANISTSHNHLVGPFLAAIAYSGLQGLTIRDGSLSASSFNHIATFTNLRSLKILDAIQIKDFSLFDSLGRLPVLEDLSIKTISFSYPRGEAEIDKISKLGFHDLKFLSITGTFALIRDVVNYVGSPLLNFCYISAIVRLNAPTRTSTEASALSSVTKVSFSGKRAATPVMKYQDEELSCESAQDLADVFLTMQSRWSDTMRKFVLRQHDVDDVKHASVRKTIWLPQTIFQGLKLVQGLINIEIWDWPIHGLDGLVNSMTLSSNWAHITLLQLPINKSFVKMQTLEVIAKCCHQLEHLQVLVELQDIPSLDDFHAPLCHCLQILSIGSKNTLDSDTQQLEIEIARYINFLFPYVKSVISHSGWSSPMWDMIHELVKLCQRVREDDKRRHI